MTLDMSAKLRDLPDVLFRAFPHRTYAEDFVRGRFRLGSLAYYRDVADESRRDSSEGTASYRSAGGVETQATIGNHSESYLLCCATNDVDLSYLRNKMGEYIVKIHDPSALVREMESFLEINRVPIFNGVHGRLAEYTKNEAKHGELDSFDNFDLCFRQKNRGYAAENEYRLFFILSRQDSRFIEGEHFKFDLGNPLDFAEILA